MDVRAMADPNLPAAIWVVVTLRIADALAAGPRAIAPLAAETGCDPGSLYRLLRFLAAHGLFTESKSGLFSLTPLAEQLQVTGDGSAGDDIALPEDEHRVHWRCAGDLLYSVRTGAPAFDHLYGRSFWDALDTQPGARAQFHQHRESLTDAIAVALAQRCEWSTVKTLVDVGCGSGTMAAVVLRAHTHLRAIVMDLPGVVDLIGGQLEGTGVLDRVELVGGTFFDSVPTGGDVYLLANVIHNWDDRAAARILSTIRQNTGTHARVLIVDRIVPHDNERQESKSDDLTMLLLLGGRERTRRDFEMLTGAAGYTIDAIAELVPPHHAISIRAQS
jgi:SAM-dependent methyltransferase